MCIRDRRLLYHRPQRLDSAIRARLSPQPQPSAHSYKQRLTNYRQHPMFESLSQRLNSTIERLRGRARLTEENIRESLREVRIALLEADVALPVVQALVERIKVRAVGQEVLKSLTPGQALIKVVRDELTTVMGAAASDLNLNVPAPAVILMAGLQGAGKTTTVAKLARHLKERRKKKVMVVSADVYRPAAIEQLKTLAQQVDVLFFASDASQKPEAIVRAAIDDARKSYVDVLIVDTAGRTSIDDAMMAEIKALHAAVSPVETLFVVDAMTGQDAAVTAKHFSEALPLTGVVLTKTDGDARGGAALSVRYITGKPVKFIGTGEIPDHVKAQVTGKEVPRMVAIINSMTKKERRNPALLNGSRRSRIAKGAGMLPADVNKLMKQYQQMEKMMSKMGRGGMKGLMRGMQGMMGGRQPFG